MTKTILNSEWFSTIQGTIGVVAVKRDNNKWCAYIGLCSGHIEEFDAQHIADLGSPVRKTIAQGIFPQIKLEYNH